MAATVKMSIGKMEVPREESAPRFTVEANGAKLGEVIVSKGGIRWIPRDHQADGHYANWGQFDRMMREMRRK